MPDFSLSTHAQYMLQERKIAEAWVWRTIENPGRKKKGEDGNIHYTKPIRERDGLFYMSSSILTLIHN